MVGTSSFQVRGFGDAGGFGDVEESVYIMTLVKPDLRIRKRGFGDSDGFGDAGGFDYEVRRRPERGR